MVVAREDRISSNAIHIMKTMPTFELRKNASRSSDAEDGRQSSIPRSLCWVFLLMFSAGTLQADNQPPPGFTALFNGNDFTNWRVPEGDGGHWKVIEGVIDYDAQSQAPGDKNLWSEREFGDFTLLVDWKITDVPYVNPNVFYVLPDGNHGRDVQGKELRFALPDSDSGIFLRGSPKHQVNIWCWPIGSGEMYGVRMDRKMPPEVRAGATPRTQADNPVGEWNRFEITVRGKTVSVVLNGKLVIPEVSVPDLPARGRLALQHHGGKRNGEWVSSPSLMQFKNIFIKELDR
jgi:hypothetical protein